MKEVQAVIDRALAEDMPRGDVTTGAIVPPGLRARASLLAKEAGVLAGIAVFTRVFKTIDPGVRVFHRARDGEAFRPGRILAEMTGPADVLLRAERTALNLIQRMCGIATLTRAYVEAVSGTKAMILDTRKTTPGLRDLEKYAVRAGGGLNHRRDLSSMILIKDNHLALAGGVAAAVRTARTKWGRKFRIEVEAATTAQALEAVEAGADWIMLDNMSPVRMKKTVGLIRGRAEVEASGGVRLADVRRIAETGVDYISVGKLTHSIRAIDLSLEIECGGKDGAPWLTSG